MSLQSEQIINSSEKICFPSNFSSTTSLSSISSSSLVSLTPFPREATSFPSSSSPSPSPSPSLVQKTINDTVEKRNPIESELFSCSSPFLSSNFITSAADKTTTSTTATTRRESYLHSNIVHIPIEYRRVMSCSERARMYEQVTSLQCTADRRRYHCLLYPPTTTRSSSIQTTTLSNNDRNYLQTKEIVSRLLMAKQSSTTRLEEALERAKNVLIKYH